MSGGFGLATAAAAKKVVGFGKHKGKSFQDLASTEPGYCQFVLGIDQPSGAMKELAEFLQASGVSAAPPSGRPRDSPRASQAAQQVQALGVSGGLDERTKLVLELLPEKRFAVVPEAVGSVASAHGGPRQSATAFLPAHVFSAIGKLQGAQLLERKHWTFPLQSHDSIAASLEQLTSNLERIPRWVLALTRAQAQSYDAVLDQQMLPAKLLPYQLEGVKYGVAHNGRCLIGDEMGLGKTLQALALAAQYHDEWPVMVVCPATLRWVWKDQIEEWLPTLACGDDIQVIRKGADVFKNSAKFWIVSYSLLASDSKNHGGRWQTRPDGSPHNIVVVDESHNIKEWSAERTKAIVPVVRSAKRVFMLSGTPTRNNSNELHPQLCGLLPNFQASYQEFKSRYCLEEFKTIYGGKTVGKVVGARNARELNALLTGTVMIRRLKKDVLLELPEKRRQRVPLEVSDSRQMKSAQKEFQGLSDTLILGGVGGQDGTGISTLLLQTAKAKLPAIKEYIIEVLERSDEKVIFFAHHRLVLDAMSEIVEKQLGKTGLTHIRIDGRTDSSKRHEMVKAFQTDARCRVAVLSITACGEGLTLTAAGLVVFAELYWVPGAMEQAEARAHRMGSKHARVIVEFLVARDSPDEIIYNSLERKKKDTSTVLDGKIENFTPVGEAERFGALIRGKRKRAEETAAQPVRPDEAPPAAKRSATASAERFAEVTSQTATATSPPTTEATKFTALLRRGKPSAPDEASGVPAPCAVDACPTPAKSLPLTMPPEDTPSPVARGKVNMLLKAFRERHALSK